jgi:tRNA threonylcarbamoyl adenosine modification protein (Sua5/YciO/YrdC/YwlC family)
MTAELFDLKSVTGYLKQGGVVLAPTDTVWGLMCDFENRSGLNKILNLKHSQSRPFALLFDDWGKLESFGLVIPDYVAKLAAKFWPGAMTIVLKSASPRIRYVAGPGNTIGIRIPAVAELLDLINEFGKPLAATSANFTGQPAAAALSQIPDEIKKNVDVIYNISVELSGTASTVIDCTGPAYKIIRQGDIKNDNIEAVVAN